MTPNTWRIAIQPQYIFNGAVANGVGKTIPATEFKNAIIELSSASSGSFVIKAQWAMGIGTLWNTAPNFGTSKSATNPWDYLEMIDLNDGSSIDGDTWITFAWTDDVRLFEVNINAMDFLNFEISSYTAGSVNLRVRLYTND